MTVPLERMLAAIDETTLLVPFSHVLFKSAFLQDAKAIIDEHTKSARWSCSTLINQRAQSRSVSKIER
jgi:hypothetical protein